MAARHHGDTPDKTDESRQPGRRRLNNKLKAGPLVDKTPELSCPLLGLFGADDRYPSPEQVAELEEALKAAGKTYEFHSYEGAGHAFFSVNRPAYRPEAAADGWEKIFAFYGKYLAA